MSKSTIGGIVVALIILIGGGAYLARRDSDDAREYETKEPISAITSTPTPSATVAVTPSASTIPRGTATPTPTVRSGYTLADVTAHASRTDCWVAVNGNVYNLTTWIAQHPGGPAAIAKLCGTDGSAAFNKQHGGQAQANAALAQFKIGALQ